jgi:hypothetical protein
MDARKKRANARFFGESGDAGYHPHAVAADDNPTMLTAR